MKPPPLRHLLVLAAIAAILALAVIVVLTFNGVADRKDTVTADLALADALDRILRRSVAATERGIALRPFETPNGDAETAALAAAICESIGARLARMPELRIVPCRSTGVALAAGLDDRALSRLLAADHLVSGRLHPLPDGHLQIRLELTDIAGQRRAWLLDERVERGALQGLPVRASSGVTAALGMVDTAPPAMPIAQGAYASFVRARELARRPSIDDRRQAVRLLDEVLAIEPAHTDSLFLRHNVRGWLLGNDGSGGSVASLNVARATHVQEGVALARRLVASDPQDLRGQWLLLGHEMELREMTAGFRRLDAMLALNPRLPGVLRLAARLHLHTGYVREAKHLALAAAQLNALDAEAYEILALVAGIERNDDAMREFASIARQMGHVGLGRIEVFDAWRRRDWLELERAHTAWVSWGGQWSADWVPAWVKGVVDPLQRETAAHLLDAQPEATRQHFASYFVEYVLLGDAARSLAAIEIHAKLPPATWMQHLWWPEFAKVRRSPRFVAAMADLGFTRLWDARGAPDLCRRATEGRWSCF